MKHKVWLLWQIARHFGLGWILFRVRYAWRLRSGALRRALPLATWQQLPIDGFLTDKSLDDPAKYFAYRQQRAPHFFFQLDQIKAARANFPSWDEVHPNAVDLADEIVAGTLRYFSHTVCQVGSPPDWHVNPFTGQRMSADRHWSQIDEYAGGDIKLIWEASRFGFTYALVRAYARTGDERYAEHFWQWVADWRQQNLPQHGPNWRCGQETSFRVMAWCFGLYGFLTATSTTPERVQQLAQMIAVSGQRVEANLDYAISQRNNHGISEALGLWTIGTLFPEFKPAAHWQALGRRALEDQARDLIDDDGAFTQHSVNYHRVMLHDYLWALRLAEVNGLAFDPVVADRFERATDWLYRLLDTASGRVSNYGQNDGALILPLSNCDYQDYRPALQTAVYFSRRTRCFESGAWTEDLLWLFGAQSIAAPVVEVPLIDLEFRQSGYALLRAKHGFVFTRSPSYRSRPGQADALQVDVWWRGQNVALDAGTYSYNAPAPWNNSLAQTAYHNTVTVDDCDQMQRAGRFLWLPWLHSRMRPIQRSTNSLLAYWEGEHDGYQRLPSPVTHRRAIVQLGDEHWLILDRLVSQQAHRYQLHWLLPEWSYTWAEAGQLTLNTSNGPYTVTLGTTANHGQSTIVRADPLSPRGWRAPYYHDRQPAVSLTTIVRSTDTWFWTVFGPASPQVQVDGLHLKIAARDWRALIELQDDPVYALVARLDLSGEYSDRLVID